MVGTFYRASQPGAPAFVEEGDAVSPGQIFFCPFVLWTNPSAFRHPTSNRQLLG